MTAHHHLPGSAVPGTVWTCPDCGASFMAVALDPEVYGPFVGWDPLP